MSGWVVPFVRYDAALGRVPPAGSVPTPGMRVLRGLSAYEIAVANGYGGTESAWLASLGGGGGSVSYTHTQAVASAAWTVNHGLGYRPEVTVLSVGGQVVGAGVIHTSLNQFVVTFDFPEVGQVLYS